MSKVQSSTGSYTITKRPSQHIAKLFAYFLITSEQGGEGGQYSLLRRHSFGSHVLGGGGGVGGGVGKIA